VQEIALLSFGVVVAVGTSGAQPTSWTVLNRCDIVCPGDKPSYLSYAIEDLRGYVGELTGEEVHLAARLDTGTRTAVLIGPEAAHLVDAEPPSVEALGEEGYVLKSGSRDGRAYVLATGATPKGTMYALAALMKAIRTDGGTAYVPGPLDLMSKPSFAVRGMHLNGWPIRRPYGFRAWTEDDWHRYIDVLYYQGVNLLYIWPFMEIIPLPLTAEDEAYLREFRRVVDYAQTRRGMEVWMMQSPNRVARDDCGVADPRLRPYWRASQVDMDPSDPAQFAAIMDSREALYRIVDNVDGVCVIDSDPGGWIGSPLSEHLKILNGCRELLDRRNIHRREAKLINWLWQGWGRRVGGPPSLQLIGETIRAMKADLPDPWLLIAGTPIYLPVCQAEGVLDRTVYLPYGTIEGEPSYPSTNIGFESIASLLGDTASYPGLLGVMGNTMCPLLQFPRVYDYLATAWDLEYLNRPEHEVLLDTSRALYPDHARLIAECFASLAEQDVARIDSLIGRLDPLMQEGRLGRPGVLGRRPFPDSAFVAYALLLQMRLGAATEHLYQGARAGADQATCARLVEELLDAYLTWDAEHGWHVLWGSGPWQLGNLSGDSHFVAAVGDLRRLLGDDASVNAFFDDIGAKLAARHDPASVAADGVEPMRQRVLTAVPLTPNPARDAAVSASVVPDEVRYPPRNAVDGDISTLYWPGALVTDNEEWLELAWPRPQTFRRVDAYFLRHDSMWKRTVHLQRQTAAGAWEDIATSVPVDSGAYAVARFELSTEVSADRIRLVNLLDLFEVEVH